MIWFIYIIIAFLTFILLAKGSLMDDNFGALIFCLFVSSIWPLFWTSFVLIIFWIVFKYILK